MKITKNLDFSNEHFYTGIDVHNKNCETYHNLYKLNKGIQHAEPPYLSFIGLSK